MSEPVFVGVDVGTQSAKAAVFELSGTCLAEASVPLPLYRRAADEVEQEPEDFYRAATAAIAVLCRRLGPSRRRGRRGGGRADGGRARHRRLTAGR